ncbi:hypothetical protein G7074_16705 [Pedobacter sp. HDW13]|uniref:hypothetical protein n=1 Tax=unclassified Pedobacter TaxID=2628915 RepID=UPI000F5B398E|nr:MULTISPECIES: hypothetical protein [unclassified Pedobacter]QIL40757.1 hypothetical protein G7074_16705 [Pedobacter sp. HDW13]RQO71428.1 hypothetical protein DBR40_16615 [Pedobacter sp. KBW01]
MTIIGTIWLVAAVIFFGFMIALYFGIKIERKKAEEIQKVYDKINAVNSTIKHLGKIGATTNAPVVSATSSTFLSLKVLMGIERFSSSEHDYWIEFHLEKLTEMELNFRLEKVEVYLDDVKFDSNLSVLYEKVPEYLSPPYGNRYYNTQYFNNYFLGVNAQRFFIFKSKITLDQNNPVFKDSDFIKIYVSYNKINPDSGKYEEFSETVFTESFKKMKFQDIISIDEQLDWIDD